MMTQMKERAVELIERIPEEKILQKKYISATQESCVKYFEKRVKWLK